VRHRVLYDSDCGFCRWALGWILRWDTRRRLEPVAIQEPRAAELLASVPEERRLESWHLVGPDGSVRSGGSAAAPLLRLLPAGAPLAALARSAPALVDRGYRWVAAHRSALARPLRRDGVRRADAVIASRSSAPPN
jgi:predicted DCC family thiol-disulfide oxidoreductase YuxK